MENVIIRNIEEKDIPSVVDIQISGWQIAYKGIIDDSTLSSMNRDEKIEKSGRKMDNFAIIRYICTKKPINSPI